MEDTTRITVHNELNTSFSFHGQFGKSRLMASNEITIHEKKTSYFDPISPEKN